MKKNLLDTLLDAASSRLSKAKKCYVSVYNSIDLSYRRTYIAWKLDEELIVPDLMLRLQCVELTPYQFDDVEKDYDAWYVITRKGDVFLNGSVMLSEDVHIISSIPLSAKEAAIWVYFEMNKAQEN